jgi:hypothetical protein
MDMTLDSIRRPTEADEVGADKPSVNITAIHLQGGMTR